MKKRSFVGNPLVGEPIKLKYEKPFISWEEWDAEQASKNEGTKVNQGVTKTAELHLKGLLAKSPLDVETAYRLMGELGFSRSTTEHAKKRLGILSAKRFKLGEVASTWTWHLEGARPLGLIKEGGKKIQWVGEAAR